MANEIESRRIIQLPETESIDDSSYLAIDSETNGTQKINAENLMNKKANVDGYYENMTVGNAEQLLSTKFTEDKVPYLFRSTGGTADVGNREYDTIIGGSVVFNQLVEPFNTTSGGVTSVFNSETGVIELSGTSTGTYSNVMYNKNVVQGHKYYMKVSAVSNPNNISFTVGLLNAGVLCAVGSAVIQQSNRTGVSAVGLADYAVGTDFTGVKIKAIGIDLTQMFGTDIADYVYQLEQATAGSGIAWLKSQGFLTEEYIPFNTGEIKSVSGLVSHDMTGFNQWDEEWELGYIADNGVNAGAVNTLRSKNYIRVIPNSAYCITTPYKAYIRYYDLEKNFIGKFDKNSLGNVTPPYGLRTIPSNCAYIRFYIDESTYNNDICINLSWSGYRNGEYEPYVKHSYPLDSTLTLRGIPKITDGKIYYDGDVYNSDGSVVRKYGVVDLGSLNWSYQSAQTRFYTGELQGLIKPPITGSEKPNCCCSSYKITSFNDFANSGDCAFGTTGNCFIMDSNYTDATAFKTAMQGVYLIYELAEPTTEQAEPFTNPQICDDFGTEEYVTTGIPVGHETKYPANLRDKLQHLPNLANADGDYIIRQSSNDMVLVPIPTTAEELPDAPTTDGNYVLKCSVADGEVTYTWESEE